MAESHLTHASITRSIIGAFYDVHSAHGFGFLEATYTQSLECELRDRGHQVSREHAVRVFYKHHDVGFHRLDMVVDGKVVVEIKATAVLHPIAKRQLFSYLKSTGLEVGLLLHFGPRANYYRVFVPNADTRTL